MNVVMTDENLDECERYVQVMTGKEPHKEMLASLHKSNNIQFRTLRHNGHIVGLRAYSRVLFPFDGALMGWALIVDCANGHDITPEEIE